MEPVNPFPALSLTPASGRPELLAAPTAAALHRWADEDADVATQVLVAAIDPDLADTAAFTTAYGVPPDASANCVVVLGRRGGQERPAAAVVLATTRADVNNAIRRRLDVRRASFMPTDRAVAETGMEYGGITPLGLPADWPVLVDSRVVAARWAVIGSGIRGSKVALPGNLLGRIPGVTVADGVAG